MIASHSLSAARDLRVAPGERAGEVYPTIQEAVDAAQPGDVVRIAGGVYFETVTIKASGTSTQPIILRPETNQPVVINAGKRLELQWSRAEGLEEVYQARLAGFGNDSGLWEMPARVKLAKVHSAAQVGRRLGSWYYEPVDSESGILYVRSTRSAAPEEFALWLENAEAAAVTLKGSHLRLSDLATTLGQNGFLLLPGSVHITLENCRAYCNSLAGIHASGRHHVIAHNETFLNNTYGIQLRHEMEALSVIGNHCYHNGPNNGERSGNSVATDLGIYGKGHYNLFEGNVVDGVHEDAFRNKGAENPTNLFRGNIIRGNLTTGSYGVYGNTFLVSGLGMREGMFRNGGEPAPQRSWERVDPSGILRRVNLIYPLADHDDPLFADPTYSDFRLQEGSPYRGRLSSVSRVYYIDPVNGSDEHDGLSVARPMATLARALSQAPASATLYLLPGIYTEPVAIRTGGISRHAPLRLRAYQKSDQVILRGGMQVEGSRNLVLEHLQFERKGLLIQGSTGVHLQRCTFQGSGSGLIVEKSAEARVERCAFDKAEVRFIDSPVGRITHSRFSPGTSQPQANAESTLYTAFNQFTEGAPFIAGDDFAPVGAVEPRITSDLEIRDAEIRGLSPSVASVLWNSPRIAAEAELELRTAKGELVRRWTPPLIYEVFGEAFDMRRPMEAFYSSERHVGLDGLTPGESYQVSITQKDRLGRKGATVTLSFTTPVSDTREGSIYYISPSGDDSRSGSREEPWRSFAYAIRQLAPGDELVLQPGVYREILRPRISGSIDRKIRIRAEIPHQAVIDLEQALPVAVELLSAHHLEIEGLRIRGGLFPYSVAYFALDSHGIALRNGRMDYPKGSDFKQLKLGYAAGVLAHLAPDLVVADHLFLCAITGVSLSHSPRSRVEHNTFVGEGNYGVVMISGTADEPYIIRHNLFYRTILGYKTNPSIWGFGYTPKLVSDGNLFYIPEGHKGTVGALPGLDRVPFAEWQRATGLDLNSQQAKPHFTAPEQGEFSLLADSPGEGTAPDGTNIGISK